ncbi:MAG: hypothetical protein Q7T21_04875 [Gallionella sp.]|nr:hypothetical protein [Gallionella sp.]
MTILVIITLILSIALLVVWLRWRQAVRADYIRTYIFPSGIFAKLQFMRPELSLKDCQLVGRALRQFFLAHLKSGGKFVAMPSQVTAELWHELTLYTRDYEAFCNKAFGRFLHYTEAVALGADRQDNAGLSRAWRYTCIDENIDPRNPLRLPLLFALDAKLNIGNGFRYAPKRESSRQGGDHGGSGGDSGSSVYYGEDFSSTSYDGCTDGLGDSSSGDGCGDGGGGDGGGD